MERVGAPALQGDCWVPERADVGALEEEGLFCCRVRSHGAGPRGKKEVVKG